MKKLLFASACVAAVATFGAEIENHTGFEDLTAGTTLVGEKNDNGQDAFTSQSGFLFVYEGAEGSTDGSVVKAYGANDDNLPLFDYKKLLPNWFETNKGTEKQANYLELSTEGGTLWRSATEIDRTGDPWALGTGYALVGYEEVAPIYVDTMVQFTPTEDGGTPAVSEADKLAIWLDVQQQGEGETATATTNLCVLAKGIVDGNGTPSSSKKFVLAKEGIEPGVWYRLTVKLIPDVAYGANLTPTPGFMIYLDGVLLKAVVPAEEPVIDPGFWELVADWGSYVAPAEVVQASNQNAVFVSLALDSSEPYFQGVGFKGSGAIDDLCISTEDPNFYSAAGSLDFTLTWGENVSAVSYTIGGETLPATSGVAIQVPAGTEVTVDATAADWYKITGGTGTFTVTEATAKTITAELAATPADAGATTLPGVTTADAQAWAAAKGLTPAAIADKAWALNAFLLNSDLEAEPQLKITSIEQVEDGWNITVEATAGDKTIDLDTINGQLQVKTAADLAGLKDATPTTYDFDVAAKIATIKVTGDKTNFMKATVTLKK